MKRWVAAALLIASMQTTADTLRLYTGAATWHFDYVVQHLPEDYESLHKLFAFEYKRFFVGYTNNTFKEDLFFVGYNYEWRRPYFDIGINVGLNYGYKDCFYIEKEEKRRTRSRKICPMAAVSIFSNTQTIQPGIQINPTYVGFTVRWEIDL